MVVGSPGSGKSFGVGRAVDDAIEQLGVSVVWVELAGTPTELAFFKSIYLQVTGMEPPARAVASQLRRMMERNLAEDARVLVLDEAQHASPLVLRNLRWLHDKPNANFALVIAGTPDLKKTVPPEIADRRTLVQLQRLADSAAPGWLAQFHPLFNEVDPELLSSLNRGYARGSYRWWAKLLRRAVDLKGQGKSLTDQTVPLYTMDLD
jgi:hypothetical protein